MVNSLKVVLKVCWINVMALSKTSNSLLIFFPDDALKPRSATHYPSSSPSSSLSPAKPSLSRHRRPPGEVVFCAPCGRETRSADRRAIESGSIVLQLHAHERDALGTLRRRHRRRKRRKGRVGDDGGRGYRRVWLFERGSDRENE